MSQLGRKPIKRRRHTRRAERSEYQSEAMWRGAVMMAGGWRCAGCGYNVTRYLEADHIIPKSAGGLNDVANGLVACGEFGSCRLHPRKTASEPMIITREMLRDDQVAYLSEKGWVEWVPEGVTSGDQHVMTPTGPGWKHFAPFTQPVSE